MNSGRGIDGSLRLPADGDQRAALRALLRSARAWIQEAAEEGWHSFTPRPSSPVHDQPPERAPLPTAHAGADTEPPRARAKERPTLEQVRAQLGECTRCQLSKSRSRIVFGDGHPDADLMFIGEGPGEQEDEQGLPFVGRAGDLLTRMIERGLEIPRSEVYICNIVKCRPPRNRTPLPDEVSACRPFLDLQIDAVAPRVIVALGRPATSLLLGRDVAISRVRGSWHRYRGIPVMPTFHPAFILRQYTEENRRLVWEDLKAALALTRGS